MYNSTGVTADQFRTLYDHLVKDYEFQSEEYRQSVTILPSLGLRTALIVTLMYLRRNRVQADLAEHYEVSQPTISRAIKAVTILLDESLEECVPTLEDVPKDTPLLVDGTLLPCWDWDAHPDLYSGKHHQAGVNIQLITDLQGHIR